MTYPILFLMFLTCAAASTLLISRAPKLWMPCVSLLATVGTWIALVAERPMTPTTASIAAVTADLSILAIGIFGSMRLLSMFDTPPGPSDGRWSIGDDAHTPHDGPPGATMLPSLDWEAFPSELAHWERAREHDAELPAHS